MIAKSPALLFKKYGTGVGPFWDLKKEGADIFEIVFIGLGPATMIILGVEVIPGDARPEG